MKSIDAEILEVERRLHVREAAIRSESRELRQRGARALMSPVTIVGALALGFVVAGAAARRRAREPLKYRDRRRQPKEQTKGLALGGLAMTAATWVIRNQFGGPAGLAQFLISKVRKHQDRGQLFKVRPGA
ncbi:MAG TPA: hypothetical protein VNU96_00575 [Burkholderiales bacterium]|jgi:hypothetical protein|nr:hypothetical protein [Burkholderiales bacterium]